MLDTVSVVGSAISGSLDMKRKDDEDSAIGAELLNTVRIVSMVTSQISYASFGVSIPSGERESFSVFSLLGIPE